MYHLFLFRYRKKVILEMYNSIIAEIIISNHYNHFHYIHDGISTLESIERYC